MSTDVKSDLIYLMPRLIEIVHSLKLAKRNCIIGENDTPKLLFAGSNPLKCLKEVDIVKKNWAAFLADIQSNTKPFQDLFNEGVNIYTEVVVIVRDCKKTSRVLE